MIAYNPLWLQNLFIRQQTAEAADQKLITEEELTGINAAYPVQFYSPNIFIRVGLFILTIVILLFSFGLFALLLISSIEKGFAGLAIFFGLLSYAALEYFVKSKNHFQSGVDDALLWISAGSLFGGITYLMNAGSLSNCLLIFIISLYCALRFADRVMSAVLFISLLGIFFFFCIRMGGTVKAFVPFVLMAVSLSAYLLVKRIKQLNVNYLYSDCLQAISIMALFSFDLSGNYYVVRELSNSMFDLHLAEGQGIPFGWLFWLFTFAIPGLYILRGIQKKNIVLLRLGLLLVAAIIFTVRYYYFIASIEVSMTIGGILLVIISYGLTRYLKTPKYGFINLEINFTGEKERLHIESLILAETFATQPGTSESTNFGGGSFGGGGASGEY